MGMMNNPGAESTTCPPLHGLEEEEIVWRFQPSADAAAIVPVQSVVLGMVMTALSASWIGIYFWLRQISADLGTFLPLTNISGLIAILFTPLAIIGSMLIYNGARTYKRRKSTIYALTNNKLVFYDLNSRTCFDIINGRDISRIRKIRIYHNPGREDIAHALQVNIKPERFPLAPWINCGRRLVVGLPDNEATASFLRSRLHVTNPS